MPTTSQESPSPRHSRWSPRHKGGLADSSGAVCKGLAGAQQEWGGGGGRQELDGQAASNNPLGAVRDLGAWGWSPSGPWLGYHELPGDPVYHTPWPVGE